MGMVHGTTLCGTINTMVSNDTILVCKTTPVAVWFCVSALQEFCVSDSLSGELMGVGKNIS